MGARFGGIEEQVDTYFAAPKARLKLREVSGSDAELIFYDREESGARRECTYEISRHPEASGLERVLSAALGRRTVVSKTRRVYWLGKVKVNLDEVEGLGRYLEFEVPFDGDPKAAEERVRSLKEAFGVREEDVVNSSYCDMMEASTRSG